MLETRPPALVTRRQPSKVAGKPNASMAASTPCPPVRSMIWSTGSPSVKSTLSSAPNFGQRLQLRAGLHRDHPAGAQQIGPDRRAQPDRALGEHRHRLSELDVGVLGSHEAGGELRAWPGEVRDHLLVPVTTPLGKR